MSMCFLLESWGILLDYVVAKGKGKGSKIWSSLKGKFREVQHKASSCFVSTQIHEEVGTFVESPGVRWCKRIPLSNSTPRLSWLSLLFPRAFNVFSLPARRTLSLCTGPGSTPAAFSSSWVCGSSGRLTVGLRVDRRHTLPTSRNKQTRRSGSIGKQEILAW